MVRMILVVLVLSFAPGCYAPRATPTAPALNVHTVAGGSVEEHDGWTIVHLSGAPDQIGYQHGCLLAERIDDAITVVKLSMKREDSIKDDWTFFREAAQRVLWPKVPEEYRQEITGIARGVQSRGYTYDWLDILTLNAHIELGSYWWPQHRQKVTGIPQPSAAPLACSAFVATGSATPDGGVVMGQNFWWGYLTGQRFNVIFDIAPASGYRVMMDALPGFIHSGTDFAITGAGLAITETTIGGFSGFDEQGIPEFVRMRKAAQYASGLSDFVTIMKDGNNGGYANTWLVADTNTGEIGKLELGLKAVAWSTTRDGYYFGANFPEDPQVCKLDCGGYTGGNEPRRIRWEQVLSQRRGRIDEAAAQEFLGDVVQIPGGKHGATGNTLCGRSDLDPARDYAPGGAVSNRIITTQGVQRGTLIARWGFADGSEFDAGEYLSHRGRAHRWMSPWLRDIPRQPWTQVDASTSSATWKR